MTTEITDTAAKADSVADVVKALRATFSTGRTRDPKWRVAQLEGIERFCRDREDDIVGAIAADLGRSGFEAWIGEIAGTRSEAAHARKHLKSWMRQQRQSLSLTQLPGAAWVQYEPLGVVLVIGPWNYPVFLTLGPLVAALAAGNCVVVKPSELAPASSALLAKWLPQYLDPEAVAVVEGDGATTQDLLAEGFDHALFTGGTEVGRKIMTAAAAQLTPVTLELGGKSPVIVADDADVDVTARRIVWGKLLNSGQTCIAPDYVLVHTAIRDRLIAKIVDCIADFRADQAPGGQRVVNERQFERLERYLAGTKGKVVVGGSVDPGQLTIDPTVIVDPDPSEPLMTEEIFGPILPVVSVASIGAAIDFVNSRPKPLAAYVFSRSTATQRRIVNEVPSGGAVVNHISLHCLVTTLPFGGVGASGMGAYHGRWGFETFSHRKAVLTKPLWPDIRLIYPPYTDLAVKILRRLF